MRISRRLRSRLLCGQDVIARLGLALFSFAGINHRCPLPPFVAIPSRLPTSPEKPIAPILTLAEKPVCVQRGLLELFDTQAIDQIGVCHYSRAHHAHQREPAFSVTISLQ